MNLNFFILYCALSFANVVIQTIKSLCTVKCSTFVSACVNAVAYGLYIYVIVFTNAEGLPLWGKAVITAAANFSGVYIANMLFNKVFAHEVEWVVNVSVPNEKVSSFRDACKGRNLIFTQGNQNSIYTYWTFTVYCPTSKESAMLKTILPDGSKYTVSECVKRL